MKLEDAAKLPCGNVGGKDCLAINLRLGSSCLGCLARLTTRALATPFPRVCAPSETRPPTRQKRRRAMSDSPSRAPLSPCGECKGTGDKYVGSGVTASFVNCPDCGGTGRTPAAGTAPTSCEHGIANNLRCYSCEPG